MYGTYRYGRNSYYGRSRRTRSRTSYGKKTILDRGFHGTISYYKQKLQARKARIGSYKRKAGAFIGKLKTFFSR